MERMRSGRIQYSPCIARQEAIEAYQNYDCAWWHASPSTEVDISCEHHARYSAGLKSNSFSSLFVISISNLSRLVVASRCEAVDCGICHANT